MWTESSEVAWNKRYGEEAPRIDPVHAQFMLHRSVRHFAEDLLSKETVQSLIACAQSASTSSNLQLYSIISVADPGRRAQLAELCANQAHVLRAPLFLAFFADHYRVKQAGTAVGEQCSGLDYNEFYTMAVIDASLAAERLVCAAEASGLGVCYIGALRNNPQGVADFFELPPGVVGLFGLCVGVPDINKDASLKPRIGQSSVYFEEKYRSSGLGDYDLRMSKFYDQEGMKGDVTWSMRSGRRVGESFLTGREALLPFLHKQGMDSR